LSVNGRYNSISLPQFTESVLDKNIKFLEKQPKQGILMLYFQKMSGGKLEMRQNTKPPPGGME
jgi:hypothetical protein